MAILTRVEDMTVWRGSLVLGVLGPLLDFSWGIYLSNVQTLYKTHIGFSQAYTLSFFVGFFVQFLSLIFSLFGNCFCFQPQQKISGPVLFDFYGFL